MKHRFRSLAAFLLVTLIAGCATSPHRLNVVATTGQGDPIDVTTRDEMEDCDFDKLVGKIVTNIDTNAPVVDGKKRVFIYIHGGLKGFTSSLKNSNKLKPLIEDADYYPLFIVWPSNLTKTYLEHLFLIRQGHRSKVLGPLTFPFVLLGDLAEGLIRAPGTIAQQFETLLSTTGRSVLSSGRNTRAREKNLRKSTNDPVKANRDPLRMIEGKNDLHEVEKVGRFLFYFLTLGPKLVTAPLVDGLGQPAYENMYRRTETMFRRPLEYEEDFNDDATNMENLKTYDGGTGAIARLFRRLETQLDSSVEITLVGHSMGTIVANRILRTYPKLPVTRVIYMAAACTIQDFLDSVVPFMKEHEKMEFYNVTLHYYAEARETQWKFLDLAPRGTLLEWIDNFLSDPRTEAGLTLGKWDNIILASQLIPVDVRGRVALKSFSTGKKGDPQKHGDFDEKKFKFWTPEFLQKPTDE